MKQKQKKQTPEQRNFVAKNAQRSGAGRHGDQKKDFQRQPKHRQRGEGS